MNALSDMYPNAPGHRGVDTSIEAANDIAPAAGRMQKLVLKEIQAAGPIGLTTDELAERLRLDRWSVQPRTSELRRKHLIDDSGHRRRNATGKRAIVWVVADGRRPAAGAI